MSSNTPPKMLTIPIKLGRLFTDATRKRPKNSD